MTSRYWILTLFGEDADNFDARVRENSERIRYAVWQQEECPDSGRIHIQAYIELKSAVRLTGVKSLFGSTVHAEKRRGSRDQAKAYCSKEETRKSGPFEHGVWDLCPGKRSDLEAVRAMLDEGRTEKEIAEEHFGSWCRYRKSFVAYRQLSARRRNWETLVSVYWGEPGTGKTRRVYDSEEFDSIYELSSPNCSGGAIWFDGYTAQPVLLLDDFYGWIKLSFLLRLLDRYPLKLPIKGGFVECQIERVYITSNKPWDEWYDFSKLGEALRGALERRLTTVEYFGREFGEGS